MQTTAAQPNEPFIRPDRQESFDETPSWTWPAPQHNHRLTTVDRVGDHVPGGPHRFTICLGDTVEVFFSRHKQETGVVAGISHARDKVRVQFDGRGPGQWFHKGQIYPAVEPETAAQIPLSLAVSNAEVAPPHAWSPEDAVADRKTTPSQPCFTLDDHKRFRAALRDGTITAATLKEDFQRMLASRETFIAELKTTYNATQLKNLAGNLGTWSAGRNTKDQNAKAVFCGLLRMFAVGSDSLSYSPFSGETIETAIEKKVSELDDATLAAHREKAAHRQDVESEALSNPTTLHDYQLFVARRGADALSDQQLATFDHLVASQTRDRRTKEKAPDTVHQIQSEGLSELELRITEGFHTKHQIPLWIVQLSERVDRAAFGELNRKAKMLGGHYSNFVKAQAGFQFRSQDSAQKFAALLHGDADRSPELADRKARKEASAAENLFELAADLERQAEETLVADGEKLKNTVRRAEMAASVRGRAYADQALARTMRSIAESLSKGQAQYLCAVRTKATVQELLFLLRRSKTNHIQQQLQAARKAGHQLSYADQQTMEDKPISLADIRHTRYPFPTLSRRNLLDAVHRVKNSPGAKQAAAKMHKRLQGSTDDFITFQEDYDVAVLQDFLLRAKAAGYDTRWLDQCTESYSRLRRAGLHTLPELRSALRELLAHVAPRQADDPVQKAELALIGRNIPGFFPTPRPIIRRMLELADIQAGHRVLEPSAGKGDILDALRAEYHSELQVTALELNRTLQDVLEAKGHEVQFTDFLEHQGHYDRIVMNPPFEGGADMEHVRHAFECLAPGGGRLVSVMSEGPFFRADTKAVAFRAWLEARGGSTEELPEDAFRGVEAFRQTGCRTRLVVIDKEK